MKSRIVTATLAVALGAWSGGLALAQVQEDILANPTAPAELLDPVLQNELPLQGVLDDIPLQGSIAEALPPQSPPPLPSGDWWNSLRGRIARSSRLEIGLGGAALCVVFLTGWFIAAASRRRTRRAYRRLPRTSGGSRLQGLEAVVASVQLGRTRRPGGAPPHEPLAGREWPR